MSTPTAHAPEPSVPPPGAREWLAEVLRWAIADARRGSPARPPRNRAAYGVGHLLGQAALNQREQLAFMDCVSRGELDEAAPLERAVVDDPKRQ